jgi:hypothetical protein
MAEAGAVTAVRAAVAALNAGDIVGYLGGFDSESRRWVAGFPEPFTVADVGDGLRQLHAAFEGLHLDEGENVVFGDEQFACARWRMRGVHVNDYLGFAPTGRSIDVETCEVYEIGRDLVVASWVYGDVLGQLARQIAGEPGDVV